MNQEQAAKLRKYIEEYKHAWGQSSVAPSYIGIRESIKARVKYDSIKSKLDKLLDELTVY